MDSDLSLSHGLGVRVRNASSAAEAMTLAGLNWEIVKRPMMVMLPDGTTCNVEELNALVRLDRNKVLGVVGNAYQLVQNIDTFSFFDPVITFKMGEFHSAGTLRDGSIVWLLVRLNQALKIGNDKIEKNLLLSNSHDGKRTISVSFLPMRSQDGNILNVMMEGATESRIVHKRLPQPEDGVEGLRCGLEYYRKFEECGKFLAQYELTLKEFRTYLDSTFPKKRITDTRMNKAKDAITELFMAEPVQTAWAALNAICLYTDEYQIVRNENEDKRLESVWMGGAAQFKQSAFDALQKLVADGLRQPILFV